MKKKYTVIKRIIRLIMTMLIITAIFVDRGSVSQARNRIDTSKTGTIVLSYQCDITEDGINNPTPVVGVNVYLYRVASVNEGGSFTWLSPYTDISEVKNVDINSISSQDEWNSLINPVMTYVYSEKISADATGISGSDGKATISNLELGIYLVVGETLVDKTNNCTYKFSPFFATIPTLDPETDNWVYDNGNEYIVNVEAKCEYYPNPKEITYNIYKNWVDYDSERPSSIDVSIYLDGELYETVTLSASNNWHYSWTYEEGHSWTVSEAVPSGYSVSYNYSGSVITLTNTGSQTPPETPTTPQTPETPTTPDNPAQQVLGAVRLAITEDDTPEVLGATRLPQTGQLWWPVFVLALIGIAFFTAGFISDRKKA